MQESGIELLNPIFNDLEFYRKYFVSYFSDEIVMNKLPNEDPFECFLRLLDLDNKSLEYQLIKLNLLLRSHVQGMDIIQAL